MLLAICLIGVASVMIVDLRRQVEQRARENARNLLNAVGRDFARNFEVLDLSIQEMH